MNDIPEGRAGEFWGGLSAMLVALPSAIAFGVAIFAPLGPVGAAHGALAGMVGAAVLGLVAPPLGGTPRLITAPCAPAAAVLAALSLEFAGRGAELGATLVMLAIISLLCGLFQVGFGFIRLGSLIKYMPFPVVSGYLSGVGIIIIVGQLPKLLAVPKGTGMARAMTTPAMWNWKALVVGVATIGVMVVAPRVTKRVPAAILALSAGILVYFVVAASLDPSMLTLEGNRLVIGALGGDAGLVDAFAERVSGVAALSTADLFLLVSPALTLAVLLSIDTLKTCVVLDAVTRTRHDSNRELVAQGAGNIASALAGGIPGAGQMGATLVNRTSGGRTRLSGFLEGVLALGAILMFSGLIAWIPVAALAGILVVVGVRMIDWKALRLVQSKSTILDFIVVAAVVIVAVTIGLIPASAVGIGLAILLFIREQIGGSVVRRRFTGSEFSSKRVRHERELRVLEHSGARAVFLELQGSLFFGTADQLYRAIEPELARATYLVLDMRRVQSMDVTAAHVLELAEATLRERKAFLVFAHFPHTLPSGRDLAKYCDEVGLVGPERHTRIFDQRNEAIEWIEDRILAEAGFRDEEERLLELAEMPLFEGRKKETLADLDACMERRSARAGEVLFHKGDAADELFLIRRGAVRIVLPLEGGQLYHLATFKRGHFFGEVSFLDRDRRSADALAFADSDFFVLSRARFDQLAPTHKQLAAQLFAGLALVVSERLRRADRELRVLQEG